MFIARPPLRRHAPPAAPPLAPLSRSTGVLQAGLALSWANIFGLVVGLLSALLGMWLLILPVEAPSGALLGAGCRRQRRVPS